MGAISIKFSQKATKLADMSPMAYCSMFVGRQDGHTHHFSPITYNARVEVVSGSGIHF